MGEAPVGTGMVPSLLPSPVNEPSTTEYKGVTGPRIRCPLCEWTPHRNDVWNCTCGNLWHTLETGGGMPGLLFAVVDDAVLPVPRLLRALSLV